MIESSIPSVTLLGAAETLGIGGYRRDLDDLAAALG